MSLKLMSDKDDFQDSIALTHYLAQQLLRGRLALILGSGISMPFGLPNWDDLIDRLYQSHGLTAQSGMSIERKAEVFRVTKYQNDYPGFLSAVHKSLYRDVNIDFAKLRLNATISAIGSLVMASRRGSASTVITFNYDNLLELYLRYHGYVTCSAFHANQWDTFTDVTVYHPHGFLPYSNEEERSPSIVLDQKSYSELVGKEDDPWRQLVLSKLRTRTCLFIGLSGNDDNLDSFMFNIKKTHAAVSDATAFWGITFATDDNPAQDVLWQERGVYRKQILDYKVALPNFLFGICQEAAKIARQ